MAKIIKNNHQCSIKICLDRQKNEYSWISILLFNGDKMSFLKKPMSIAYFDYLLCLTVCILVIIVFCYYFIFFNLTTSSFCILLAY